MDQCFAIDHSDFILERQAVRLTVYLNDGIQEKQDIKGFLKSKGVCVERMENCTRHRHRHTLYIFSQHQNFEVALLTAAASPERFLKLRGEVFLSDQGAHLEVFRGERTQIHNGSP